MHYSIEEPKIEELIDKSSKGTTLKLLYRNKGAYLDVYKRLHVAPGPCQLLLCTVQTGRVSLCNEVGKFDNVVPNGFDSQLDQKLQLYRIHVPETVLPSFYLELEVTYRSIPLPLTWKKHELGKHSRILGQPSLIRHEIVDFDLITKLQLLLRRFSCKHCYTGLQDCVADSSTAHAIITQVWRIENPELWERYWLKRLEFQQKYTEIKVGLRQSHVMECLENVLFFGLEKNSNVNCPERLDLNINERFLFYCSSNVSGDEVKKLTTDGFSRQQFQEWVLGTGIYFTECPSNASQFSSSLTHLYETTLKDMRLLLICRVLCGEVDEARDDILSRYSSMKFPYKSNLLGGHETFGSVVADRGVFINSKDVQQHCEFVIFDPEQIYPAYVILYHDNEDNER